MVQFITANFIPVKAHIKEQKQTFDRFKAVWTPTQLILDPNGVERYRIEGFLPVEDLLAKLQLGLGRLAFENKDFTEAERHFRAVCDGLPKASSAAEACYWAGVSNYKASNSPEALRATDKLLKERYPDSEWARKASVWGG